MAEPPGTSESTAAAIGPANITTDAANYTQFTPIVVSWAGMPTNPMDYVAIAPQGSPNTTTTRWGFTMGAASGMRTFEGPSTGGTYVARGFNNLGVFQGESDPFTVQNDTGTPATLTPNLMAYAMTDPITINFAMLPGNTDDYISIAPVGSPDTTTTDWDFTNGGTSGSVTFEDGLAPTGGQPGMYVARAYINGRPAGTDSKVGESAPFAIGLGPSVTTNALTYTISEAITVNWSALTPVSATDWVALAPAGSSLTTVISWQYNGGTSSGTRTFSSGLASPGMYVARVFSNNGFTLLGESVPFTVTAAGMNPTVTTDAATYPLGTYITIAWTGFPTNANDWIGYAPAGSPLTTVTRWRYTGGAAAGSILIEGPSAPGTYVARGFLNNRYVLLDESPSFVVQ